MKSMAYLILIAMLSVAWVQAFGKLPSVPSDDDEETCVNVAYEMMNSMAGPLHTIGSTQEFICEASDCNMTAGCVVEDGKSGDTDFPFVDMKVLATVGEFYEPTGYMLVGVPDGMGAYLLDDETVRVIFQSESYGTITRYESYPFVVNEESGATFTGSHVMYVDYDREEMSHFMTGNESAAGMVKGAGSLIKEAYNLHGDLIEPRSDEGDCCSGAAHFSNTDPNGCGCWGTIMNAAVPSRADWILQSLCSAHLETAHSFGSGVGVEDDLFLTNEEWTSFVSGSDYTGIPAHAIELATGEMHAVGVFTLGGFEKIVQVNCGHTDYVCFSPSGYNGAFGAPSYYPDENMKEGTRNDGEPYVYPQNVVPSRLYIGKKGYNAKGEEASDFLSRNGLAYGRLYGFSTDITENAGGLYADDYSKSMPPGSNFEGAFHPIDWMWDGVVKKFVEDGSWDFQQKTSDGNYFWTSGGPNDSGSKMEHNAPCPYGMSRFAQSSTAGWIGIYDFSGVKELLDAADGAFPDKVPASYTLLQGEQDITAQIELGGKGLKANGYPQTTNSDSGQEPGKATFEDIDGLYWFSAKDSGHGYLIIQEDSGNDYGERTFISKVEMDGTYQTFYWIAQSGGSLATREGSNVGIPAGVVENPGSHEFSGAIDLSGLVAKDDSGEFVVSAGDQGYATRLASAQVDINEKLLVFGLQAHSHTSGVIDAFQGDRGGQLYAAVPKLP